MITVELLHDTIVRHKAGTVLQVEDAEAKRLIAFGNAIQKKETKKRGGK